MIPFILASMRMTLLVFIGALLSATVSIFAGPWLFDYVEVIQDRPLAYEEAVRITILTTLGLFLFGWLVLVLRRLTFERLLAWLVTLAGSILILAVCLFDSQHKLQTEDSWIRYATGGFLFTTSALSFLVARLYRLNTVSDLRLRLLWWFLAFAFAFLASDELLEIHENVGAMVEHHFQLSDTFSDLITFGYATLAILFMGYFINVALREYVPQHSHFLQLFLCGVLVFFVSQVFDTLDTEIHKALVGMGLHLSAIQGFLFSDRWYPLWAPKQVLNDLEEVLECLAAILFCVGVLLVFLKRKRPGMNMRVAQSFPKSSVVLGSILVLGSLSIVITALLSPGISSPALNTIATQVVGGNDGLFHTDGLFFHNNWGLLVANEGKGNILVYDKGKIRALPDPKRMVSDTDAVTATDDAVYVSSPSRRTVFKYTRDGGWERCVKKGRHKREPEGLVVVGSTLYVVDERYHKIYAVDLETCKAKAKRLKDSRWNSPEGIAYHPGLDELLITDDTSGYVIALKFESSPRIFASPDDGLQSPEEIKVAKDGRVFLTDSGRREIIEFGQDGRVLNRIKFRRMYGFLTGIEVIADEKEENLYVVSADGFASKSFMPSSIWKIPISAQSIDRKALTTTHP